MRIYLQLVPWIGSLEKFEFSDLDELTVEGLKSASRGEDMYRATAGRTDLPSFCTGVDIHAAFDQRLRRAGMHPAALPPRLEPKTMNVNQT
eukprot:2644468-Pyramimonas_sp.AAC.1